MILEHLCHKMMKQTKLVNELPSIYTLQDVFTNEVTRGTQVTKKLIPGSAGKSLGLVERSKQRKSSGRRISVNTNPDVANLDVTISAICHTKPSSVGSLSISARRSFSTYSKTSWADGSKHDTMKSSSATLSSESIKRPTRKSFSTVNKGQRLADVLRQDTMPLSSKISYLTMFDNSSSSDDEMTSDDKNELSYGSKMRLVHDRITYGLRKSCSRRISSAGKSSNTTSANASLIVCPSVTDSAMNLMEAAEKGDASAVREALHKGGGTRLDNDCRVALQRACQYGQTSVVQELLQAGADPNMRSNSGRTLLQEACVGGHPSVIEILVHFVDDIDAVDKEGQSACHVAGFQGEVDCLQVLAENGADCSLQDGKGRTPAHLACQRNHPRILEYLLKEGLDIEIPDAKQKRPIHYAAIYGGLECLIMFIQSESASSPTDSNGSTPAHYIASHNHIDCLRFLVKHGSDKEAQDGMGRTLALMAAFKGAMTCLHWLFVKGANANAIDHQGNTPAHLAAAGGHAECFNCCVQHGTNMEVTNEKNETPMDVARRHGHPLLMSRAGNNEVRCVHCNDNYEMAEWERTHQPSQVQKAMKKSKGSMFNNPMPTKVTQLSRAQLNKQQRQAQAAREARMQNARGKGGLPKRDLAAKYFGREIDDPFLK